MTPEQARRAYKALESAKDERIINRLNAQLASFQRTQPEAARQVAVEIGIWHPDAGPLPTLDEPLSVFMESPAGDKPSDATAKEPPAGDKPSDAIAKELAELEKEEPSPPPEVPERGPGLSQMLRDAVTEYGPGIASSYKGGVTSDVDHALKSIPSMTSQLRSGSVPFFGQELEVPGAVQQAAEVVGTFTPETAYGGILGIMPGTSPVAGRVAEEIHNLVMPSMAEEQQARSKLGTIPRVAATVAGAMMPGSLGSRVATGFGGLMGLKGVGKSLPAAVAASKAAQVPGVVPVARMASMMPGLARGAASGGVSAAMEAMSSNVAMGRPPLEGVRDVAETGAMFGGLGELVAPVFRHIRMRVRGGRYPDEADVAPWAEADASQFADDLGALDKAGVQVNPPLARPFSLPEEMSQQARASVGKPFSPAEEAAEAAVPGMRQGAMRYQSEKLGPLEEEAERYYRAADLAGLKESTQRLYDKVKEVISRKGSTFLDENPKLQRHVTKLLGEPKVIRADQTPPKGAEVLDEAQARQVFGDEEIDQLISTRTIPDGEPLFSQVDPEASVPASPQALRGGPRPGDAPPPTPEASPRPEYKVIMQPKMVTPRELDRHIAAIDREAKLIGKQGAQDPDLVEIAAEARRIRDQFPALGPEKGLEYRIQTGPRSQQTVRGYSALKARQEDAIKGMQETLHTAGFPKELGTAKAPGEQPFEAPLDAEQMTRLRGQLGQHGQPGTKAMTEAQQTLASYGPRELQSELDRIIAHRAIQRLLGEGSAPTRMVGTMDSPRMYHVLSWPVLKRRLLEGIPRILEQETLPISGGLQGFIESAVNLRGGRPGRVAGLESPGGEGEVTEETVGQDEANFLAEMIVRRLQDQQKPGQQE